MGNTALSVATVVCLAVGADAASTTGATYSAGPRDKVFNNGFLAANTATVGQCASLCNTHQQCYAFSFHENICTLQSPIPSSGSLYNEAIGAKSFMVKSEIL